MHTIEEITKTIVSISSQYDVDEIYIFGSYARGEADDISDLDIAIRAPRLTIMQIASLSFKIEKSLNVEIDMIPMETMEEPFLERISKEAVKVV